jgi:hypothetical protein
MIFGRGTSNMRKLMKKSYIIILLVIISAIALSTIAISAGEKGKPGLYKINARRLNIRYSANLNKSPAKTLSAGCVVNVTIPYYRLKSHPDSDGYNWAKIKMNGKEFYVAYDYLKPLD